MVKDMMSEIEILLKSDEILKTIKIKSFSRPESLEDTSPSIVIIPIAPPSQKDFGSDRPLSKKFLYQIEVESISRIECKELQHKIENLLMTIGFFQSDSGFEGFDNNTNRYRDARTYRGFSKIYEQY